MTVGHLFCSALQVGKRYKMLSRAKEEEESNNENGEDSAIKSGDVKKKVLFEIELAPWLYAPKVVNVTTNIFSRKAHHLNAFEEAVYF